jgi:hypothetical protein
MHTIGSTRGHFIVCDTCIKILKQDGLVNEKGRAVADDISAEFCPNCYDRNKILIDDLEGSTE